MKLRKLVELFRLEADDNVEPFGWTDDELAEYATDAQNEACRRARLLVDSTTPEVCQYNVLAGDPWITLDPRVIFVRRAKLDSNGRRLQRLSYRDLDQMMDWESKTGTVSGFVTDVETGKLRLYRYFPADDPAPVPPNTATVMDKLNLTVVRLPLTDLTHPDDEIEINDRYGRNLRFWIMWRAFMKRDSELFNPTKAQEALALFEREFGPQSSSQDEEWIERTRDNTEDVDGIY